MLGIAKIKGYQLDNEKKFKFSFPKHVEKEININEINDFLTITDNIDFKIDELHFNEDISSYLLPIHEDEDVTEQFITSDGKKFYLVRNMVYGRELSLFNKDTKFDYSKSTVVEFTNRSWGRADKYKKLNLHINRPQTKMELFQSLRNKTICFTGHRPKNLGGYDMRNPIMMQLKEKLLKLIEDFYYNKGIRRFISGGALGTDTAAFWCVEIFKRNNPEIAHTIENIIAVPFRKHGDKYSSEQLNLYQRMKHIADSVIYVDELDDYKSNDNVSVGEFSFLKMQLRNEYMVDHSIYVVAVYDGSKGGTKNCVDYAQNQGKTIYRLLPQENFRLIEYDKY